MTANYYQNGEKVPFISALTAKLLSAIAVVSLLAAPAFAQTRAPERPAPAAAGTAAGAGDVMTPPVRTPSRRSAIEAVPAEEVAVLVSASEETTLSAQMAGRIQRVHVGLGESVAAGKLLMEFECSEQQSQLRAAEAEFRGARETHLTKLKLQALGAAGELEVTVAASAADKNKSQVDLRESQLEYCRVVAPFSGKIVRLRAKASESVSLGNPLVEMVNPTLLKSQMFVSSGQLRGLTVGTQFQVRLEDGRRFKAHVSRMNARVEGVSQQLEVEGRFDPPTEGLLPGMVGTAEFTGRGRAARP